MSVWRDDKYLKLVAYQLVQFTQKSTHTYNFRCPLCGDSEKHKYKARGYLYQLGDHLQFKCHNCSVSLPFSALLKRLNRTRYDEYVFEQLDDNRPVLVDSVPAGPSDAPPALPAAPERGFVLSGPVFPLPEVADPSNRLSEAFRYITQTRQVPVAQCHRLFVTDQAKSWLLPLVGTEKAEKLQDGRLFVVQPFRLPSGEWFGCQLRALDKKDYLTFRWAHEPLKMFGLESWTPTQTTYLLEGPLDALFVPNALSPCSADLLMGVQQLEASRILPYDARRVYVWDNEPDNKDIRRRVQAAIRLGEPIVIWPLAFEYKDINDAVRAGQMADPATFLAKRTFQHHLAQMEFDLWLKYNTRKRTTTANAG